MPVSDDDDLHQLAKTAFVVLGVLTFVAWAIYDGVGSFLDISEASVRQVPRLWLVHRQDAA